MSWSLQKRAFCKRVLLVVSISLLALVGCKDKGSSGSSGGSIAKCSTPTLAFLGEGPMTYNLPPGANSLVVKRVSPFGFEIVTAPSFTSTVTTAPLERVWSCTNQPCTTEVPQAGGVSSISLGMLTGGITYLIPVIDNEMDPQIPEIRDSMGNVVQMLPDFGLTTIVTFIPPFTDTFTMFNVDTVGIYTPCPQ